MWVTVATVQVRDLEAHRISPSDLDRSLRELFGPGDFDVVRGRGDSVIYIKVQDWHPILLENARNQTTRVLTVHSGRSGCRFNIMLCPPLLWKPYPEPVKTETPTKAQPQRKLLLL